MLHFFAPIISRIAAFMVPIGRFLEMLSRWLHLRSRCIKQVTGLKVRPNDIFLCTYPKSGTTWLQMMLFQITSDGDMDKIPHLGLVIPHLEETARDLETIESPRIFKTHLTYPYLPRGGRYIFVSRDGKDVANSYYHHHLNYMNFQGGFAGFFKKFLSGDVAYGSWFKYMASWKKQQRNPKVLFLSFEEMLADTRATIEKIIDFCQLSVDPVEMDRIVERCSFDYMKQHQEKIDLYTLFVPPRKLNFLREGKTGTGKQAFNPEQLTAYEQACNKHFGADHPLPQVAMAKNSDA